MRDAGFHQRFSNYASWVSRHFSDHLLKPSLKSPARFSLVLFFSLFLLAGAFLSTRLLDSNGVILEGATTLPKYRKCHSDDDKSNSHSIARPSIT
ncbi:hypothetical protein SDJN02_25991 [Cucurbita argyrosperma subsp. argyrosperma]|nr:hypothetical protein SDJN02_25991 [Cucurbita argyrosperma subsp. argyrosperma]